MWYENSLYIKNDRYDVDIEEGINNMCEQYIKGLIWVFNYYTNPDDVTWLWYYPYHYAPFFKELAFYIYENLENLNTSFSSIYPNTDFMDPYLHVHDWELRYDVRLGIYGQLLSVIPIQSFEVLPGARTKGEKSDRNLLLKSKEKLQAGNGGYRGKSVHEMEGNFLKFYLGIYVGPEKIEIQEWSSIISFSGSTYGKTPMISFVDILTITSSLEGYIPGGGSLENEEIEYIRETKTPSEIKNDTVNEVNREQNLGTESRTERPTKKR